MKPYNDWEKRTSETERLLERVQQEVRSVAPGAEIILYGSRARGDSGPVSDWDFLILVHQTVDRNLTLKIRNKLYDLELETDTVLGSIIRTKKDWDSPRYSVLPFKRRVEQEGVII